LSALRDEALAADTEVQAVAAEKERLGKEIIDLERALQEQAEKNEALRQKMEGAAQELAMLHERQEQSDGARQKILDRRQELSHEIALAVADIARLTEQAGRHKQDLTLLDEFLQKERAKEKKLAKRIHEEEDKARALQKNREEQQLIWNAKQQEYALAERDLQNGTDGQEDRERELEQAKDKLAELEDLQDKLQADLQREQDRIRQLQQQSHAAEQEKNTAFADQQAAIRQLNECIQQLRSGESKLQFLQKMQQAYEGFGKAVKAVLKAQESWRSGVAGAVAELIDVPREYITAVEVALGGNLQNVVTKDTDTAKAAIQYLKRERQGRVTFLPLSTLVVRPPQSIREGADDGVVGWANKLVKVDGSYQKAVDFLLSRTLVVDNLDNALRLAKNHEQRLRIVTLSGELLNPGGSLSGGSRQHAETSFLNRSGEIEELKADLAKLSAKQQELSQSRQDKEKAVAQAEENQQELQRSLQDTHIKRAELSTNLERLGENLTEQQKLIADLEQAMAAMEKSFAKLQEKKVLAKRAAAAAEAKYKELAQEEADIRNALIDIE
ncbi:MAG: chromosome segregation protein SMC, partial [Selenomonas sp.]|nr:chromosome segregation protein SMC [Selenomonas sp.]